MGPGEERLDVARVRGLFPGLSDGLVHADGPAVGTDDDDLLGASTAVVRCGHVPILPRPRGGLPGCPWSPPAPRGNV